jgi:hypothetical protein
VETETKSSTKHVEQNIESERVAPTIERGDHADLFLDTLGESAYHGSDPKTMAQQKWYTRWIFRWIGRDYQVCAESNRLYLACAKQALNLSFYTELKLAESFAVHIQLVLIHIWFCKLRYHEVGSKKYELQALLERLYEHLTRCLRRAGTFEEQVEKYLWELQQQCFRSLLRYDEAMDKIKNGFDASQCSAEDHPFREALMGNVLGDLLVDNPSAMERMVRYLTVESSGMSRVDVDEMSIGKIEWGNP